MTCPVCSKPTDHKLRPFCSRRCADFDLGRWLTESYRIETEDEPDDPNLGRDPEVPIH